jgi:hypothetical protein
MVNIGIRNIVLGFPWITPKNTCFSVGFELFAVSTLELIRHQVYDSGSIPFGPMSQELS